MEWEDEAEAPQDPLAAQYPEWFLEAIDDQPERGSVEVAGTAIETLSWGRSGEAPLLLLHGNGSHADWWCPLAPMLANDRRVAALSWSGMGRSGWRDSYTMELYERELIEGAAALGLFDGDRKPWIVAHSFATWPALHVAASSEGERFAGLIVVDNGARVPRPQWQPEAAPPEPRRGYESLIEGVSRFRLRPPQPCANTFLLEYIAMRSLVERDDGRWHWCFDPELDAKRDGIFGRDLGPVMAAARIPLAFLWGALSSLMGPEVDDRTRAFAPAGTRFVEMPEAAHHLMLDQPIAFVTAVKALVA
ncbi:MAG: alpha/beta hydrolase [Sphingomonadaceae bacterium]|nr:alpha/beta hydrolase [Sphingomonadaceae bacterium]